jgi:hypothetical protein
MMNHTNARGSGVSVSISSRISDVYLEPWRRLPEGNGAKTEPWQKTYDIVSGFIYLRYYFTNLLDFIYFYFTHG